MVPLVSTRQKPAVQDTAKQRNVMEWVVLQGRIQVSYQTAQEMLTLMYLLMLYILTVWRIESEEWIVLLGGHPVKH